MKGVSYVILVLCCVLLSCKKADDKIPITHYVSDDLKSYTYFKKGTYWIYKSDLTGYEDSLHIILHEQKFANQRGTINSYERLQIWLRTKDIDVGYIDAIEFNKIDRYKNDENDTYLATIFVEGQQVDQIIDELITDNRYDSIEVSGKIFYDIVQNRIDMNPLENFEDTHYYFARNIGVIKKTIYHESGLTENWNLIRWQIL